MKPFSNDIKIYTLTLNPAIDYHLDLACFDVNKINVADNTYFKAGGKGINVTRVLNDHGYDVTALGFYAGFTGEKLKELLTQDGIKNDFIKIKDQNTRINVKLHHQKEIEINGNTLTIEHDDIKALFDKLSLIKDNSILVLSGSVPQGFNDDIYQAIMNYLKDRSIDIYVDARKQLLIETLSNHPFLIKPNIHELEEIFDITISNEKQLIYYGNKLISFGACNVMISLGDKGAYLFNGTDNIYKANAPSGAVVNAIGAGDSMIAGFIIGYLSSNNNLLKAFKYALAAGSATAFSKDLGTKAEISALLDQINIIKIKEN